MSWIDVARGAICAAALAYGGVAVAETLVVRSSGPSARSFPPGKAIPDSARIVLKANDQVVVLDGRGTRTLKGPGSFSPTASAAPPAETRTTLASLVNQRSERRARIGAVRGGVPSIAPDNGKNPNIWYVDVERNSSFCVADPAAVTLWRADAGAATEMTLAGADGKSEKTMWLKGQSAKPWPAALPIANGAEYRISWPGAAAPTVLKFAVLGTNPQGLEDTAAALIKNGCQAQLDLLIETVAVPDGEKPAAG